MSRSTDLIIRLAGLIIITAGLRAFGSQVAPIFFGLVMAIAVSPVQGWARAKGWPGWVGMMLALLTGYGALLAIVLALVWSVTQVAALVSSGEYNDRLATITEQINDQLHEWNFDTSAVQDTVGSALDVDSVLNSVRVVLNQATSLGSTVSLLLVTMFFMTVDSSAFGRQLSRLSGPHPLISSSFRTFGQRTRQYLWVSTVFGLIVAVLDGAALAMMGIPLVGVWVLVSFVTNYIPNVGFILGVIPPALVALLDQGFSSMVWVVVIYVVLNFVIQSLIQPRFVGDTAGLSTTLTFLSLIFWSWVMGPIGAFLAVPASMLAKTLLVDIDPTMREMSGFITLDDPDDDPDDDTDPSGDDANSQADGPTPQSSDRSADAGTASIDADQLDVR